jgi:broad specificity phosphatase PhoE
VFGTRKAAPAYGADGETPKQFADGSAGDTGSGSVRDSPRLRNRTLTAVFVRHGDTKANRGTPGPELVRGQTDFPLDASGRKEATQAGRTIARHGGVSRVYHSPLSRGRDTAKPIAAATGAKAVETSSLLPWDKGDAEGKPVSREDPKLRDYAVNKPTTAVPGGEPFSKFADRTDNAAKSIVNAGRKSVKQTGKPVAAVSHSVDMRRLPHAIEGKAAGDPLSGGPKPGEMVGVTTGNKVVRVRPGLWGSK